MLDARGVLNPGLMPRTLDDLTLIAPPRDTLDAHRVSLWNRVAEVWRQDDDFRRAVLRYATRSEQLDAVSADLWPEVVYPLIERAHWQRTFPTPARSDSGTTWSAGCSASPWRASGSTG